MREDEIYDLDGEIVRIEMTSKVPQTLLDLRDMAQDFEFSSNINTSDGRTGSTIGENEFLEYALNNGFKDRIEVPRDRHWWDFWLIEEGFPVDLKINSGGNGAGNAANWSAVLFALTGDKSFKYNKKNKPVAMMEIAELIKSKEVFETEGSDFYYMSLIKPITNNKTQISSTKGLGEYCLNANNDPHQINWYKEGFLPKRTRSNKELLDDLVFPAVNKFLQGNALKGYMAINSLKEV